MNYKTYSRHYCERRHRTYRTLAKCLWRYAAWISGDGPYALIAKCGGCWTVTLHRTAESAERSKRVIDKTACGGGCTPARGYSTHNHTIIYLDQHPNTRRPTR